MLGGQRTSLPISTNTSTRMSNSIVTDSSALVSLISQTDSNHKKALSNAIRIKNIKKAILIPSEVFAETINILGKKFGHKVAVASADEILNSKEYKVVNTLENTRLNTFEKFKTQPKSVSFTDCIVMAFADEYETREIFGFDEVFRKNGYIRFGIDKSEVKSPK